MNIFVSNLGFQVKDEDLKGIFTEFGEVSSAKVIMDKFTSRSKGFGFVEMPDDAAAQTAISSLDGTMMEGRPLKVSVARPREEKSNRSDYKKRW